jgi:hypothetical protein
MVKAKAAIEAAAGYGLDPERGRVLLSCGQREVVSPSEGGRDYHARHRSAVEGCSHACDRTQARH